jgi:pyruvate/2-oxoglutarate dehydrogenase complex dihydrolipoamide dehydrogenase (E3) component
MTVYDLAVVGGGTAGLTAAIGAASVGARTLLVERHRTGGDCLWTGCVPSKALLAVANRAAAARTAGALGVGTGEVTVDFSAAMAHVRHAIRAIEPHDSPDRLGREGVEVVHGDARFTALDRLDVAGRAVRFRRAMIATGAAPLLPPIPGLREVDAPADLGHGVGPDGAARRGWWSSGAVRSGRSSGRRSPGSGRG